MDVDVTTKPIGSFFGGKNGCSVACPVCCKPGLRLGAKHYTGYAHNFTISLNAHNEPICEWGKLCVQRTNPLSQPLADERAPAARSAS